MNDDEYEIVNFLCEDCDIEWFGGVTDDSYICENCGQAGIIN